MMNDTRMRMRWLGLLLALVATSLLAGRLYGKPASSQAPAAQCSIVVPQDWGDYLDSGTYGVVFRDQGGTLRIVNRFPCGLEGAPNVVLEIRRK